MWNRKGREPSHGSLLRLYYAGQEATFVIQWDHNSPATSTDSAQVINVKEPSGDGSSPPKVDKPASVKIHQHVGGFNVHPDPEGVTMLLLWKEVNRTLPSTTLLR